MKSSDPPVKTVLGQRRGELEEKVMRLAFSSTPLLQSPRQHASGALQRGVITDKNNREAEKQTRPIDRKSPLPQRPLTQRNMDVTFRVSANGVMNTRSSPEVIQINVGTALVKFHQQPLYRRIYGVNITDIQKGHYYEI